MKSRRKRVQDFILTFVLFYVCATAFLYFKQRSLIYFPSTTRMTPPANAEVARVTTSDGLEIEGWFFPPQEGKPVLLYFHGNAGSIAGRLIKIPDYLNAGYGVLLAEYRGYGGNPGEPSEDNLYKDGWAYLDWLENQKGIGLDRTVFYGESLGTGVCVELASKLSEKGQSPLAVVLEAPYSSLLNMARKNYFFVPVDYLLLDRIMSNEKIGKVHAPLFVINGQYDEVIPITQGQDLFNLANEPKKYLQISGGHHGDLHLLGLSGHVLDFLAGVQPRNKDN